MRCEYQESVPFLIFCSMLMEFRDPYWSASPLPTLLACMISTAPVWGEAFSALLWMLLLLIMVLKWLFWLYCPIRVLASIYCHMRILYSANESLNNKWLNKSINNTCSKMLSISEIMLLSKCGCNQFCRYLLNI